MKFNSLMGINCLNLFASHDSSATQTYNEVENIYYQTAQKVAETADILIVNHSLLADASAENSAVECS